MNRAASITIVIACALICCARRDTAAQSTQPHPNAGPTTACRFSRDGSEILVARGDAIVILSAHDGSQRQVIHPGLERVSSFDPSVDGRLLLAGGGVPGVSGAALIVDRSSGRILATAGGF